MNLTNIRAFAKTKGVQLSGKMRKNSLIRAIQKAEGNSECYATASALDCDQMECLWRDDCMENSK